MFTLYDTQEMLKFLKKFQFIPSLSWLIPTKEVDMLIYFFLAQFYF